MSEDYAKQLAQEAYLQARLTALAALEVELEHRLLSSRAGEEELSACQSRIRKIIGEESAK